MGPSVNIQMPGSAHRPVSELAQVPVGKKTITFIMGQNTSHTKELHMVGLPGEEWKIHV